MVYDVTVMKRVYILFALLTVTPPLQAAGGIQLAEYRADVDDVTWSVGTQSVDLGFGDGITEPWGLTGAGASSYVEKGIRLGSYRLYGGFDILNRQSFSGAQLYDTENTVSVGPRFAFSPNTFTNLFYSLGQGQSLDDLNRDRWGGDSSTQRAGLTQTWFLARRKANITLGYGFEQSETEDLYQDLRAHSLAFSTKFPLFWGLSARIQADYALNTYDDYLGAGEVESDRQMFRAAINREFSRRLYGEFRFSYLNEEFDDTELSYRRYVWGLNLRYRY